jgi:hypothetical protein
LAVLLHGLRDEATMAAATAIAKMLKLVVRAHEKAVQYSACET